MKKGILFLALLTAILVAAPSVSSALTITVYDAYREVEASAYMGFSTPGFQEFTNNTLDGTAWSQTAHASSTETVCSGTVFMGVCIGGYITRTATATATQTSGWDLAADGSSLSVDVYQDNYVGVTNPYEGGATLYNYFGIAFTMDEAAGYSLTLDYIDAWGDALIQLYNFDSASYVFDYDSSQFGQATGDLLAGSYALEVYSVYDSYNGPFSVGGMNLGLVIGDAGGGGTEPVTVPEPGTLLLLGTGMTGLVLLRKRLAKK